MTEKKISKTQIERDLPSEEQVSDTKIGDINAIIEEKNTSNRSQNATDEDALSDRDEGEKNEEDREGDSESEEVEESKIPDWVKTWAPTAAFFGGFVFDSLTLGRRVSAFDLILVGAYALLAFLCLYLASKYYSERVNKLIQIATQFFLGGMFSALVVLYFKSAAGWYSLLFVLILVAFMVWNEFFHKRESQRELIWGVYCVCLIMTLNFIFPHIMKSISAWWFYLSTASALALLFLLRKLANYPQKVLRTPLSIAVILTLFFTLGWVPPVPLVMKNTLICVDFEKQDNEYTCNVEAQSFFARIGLADEDIHPPNGGPVHCLTAIFAPPKISAKMEHRWFHKTKKGWIKTDTLTFSVKGGREKGWRYHTRKRNVSAGKWRVETALRDGAVLGFIEFDVDRTSEPTLYKRHRESL